MSAHEVASAEERARISDRDLPRPGGSATGQGMASGGRPGRVPGRRALLLGAGLLAAMALPLAVALVVLAEPRWYPVLDMAQTELRIRDVASTEIPLIGLAGRIGPLGEQGSHPGPLSFWALWPFYQLFGASSWAMLAAAATLQLLAVGTVLWIAWRRGGPALLLGTAAILAVLLRAYGPTTLTQPWNPYLPVFWWLVFLLAVWSVLSGDLPLAPVAVAAGSFCAQTHVPYLAPVVGVTALGAVAVVLQVRSGAVGRGPAGRWLLLAALVGVAVWLPPVIDQVTSDEGNITKLLRHFGDPTEPVIGAREGVELALAHLNPGRLVTADLVDSRFADPSVLPGLVVLAVWAASVAAALRRRHGPLLALHVVVAAALLLGVITMSRIFGYVWFYLTFWAWGTTALLVVAVGWTAVLILRDRLSRSARSRLGPVAAAALVAVVVLSMAASGLDARDAELTDTAESDALAAVAPATVEALDAGDVPGGGRRGRYLVDFEIDPIAIGSQGFGMLNELEREGFDVGAPAFHGAGATWHRVLDPADATGVVHVAVGADIDVWREKPDAEEVAYVDPRSRAEREEYDRLGDEVDAGLRQSGLDDLADQARRVLFVAALDRRLPEPLHGKLLRMLELGLPVAVFVGPPSTVL